MASYAFSWLLQPSALILLALAAVSFIAELQKGNRNKIRANSRSSAFAHIVTAAHIQLSNILNG